MLHEPPTDDIFPALEASLKERHREPKSILATDADLVAYAGKALLTRGEAIALIQGFKPPVPRFGDQRIYYMDDFADIAQRLLQDAETGRLPMPCRPGEFLAWARGLDIELPTTFRASIDDAAAEAQVSPVVDGAAGTMSAPPQQRRLSNGHDKDLQRQADEAAMSWRQTHKRLPTKQEVAKIVAPAFGLTVARATRLFHNTWNRHRQGKRRK